MISNPFKASQLLCLILTEEELVTFASISNEGLEKSSEKSENKCIKEMQTNVCVILLCGVYDASPSDIPSSQSQNWYGTSVVRSKIPLICFLRSREALQPIGIDKAWIGCCVCFRYHRALSSEVNSWYRWRVITARFLYNRAKNIWVTNGKTVLGFTLRQSHLHTPA